MSGRKKKVLNEEQAREVGLLWSRTRSIAGKHEQQYIPFGQSSFPGNGHILVHSGLGHDTNLTLLHRSSP